MSCTAPGELLTKTVLVFCNTNKTFTVPSRRSTIVPQAGKSTGVEAPEICRDFQKRIASGEDALLWSKAAARRHGERLRAGSGRSERARAF